MLISTFQRYCSSCLHGLLAEHEIRFVRKSGDPVSLLVFYAGPRCGLVFEHDRREALTSLYLTRLSNGRILHPFGEDVSGLPDAVNALDVLPIHGATEVELELSGKGPRERVCQLTRLVKQYLAHILAGHFEDFAEVRKVMQWRRSAAGMAYRMEQGKAALRSRPGIEKIIDPRLLEPSPTPVLSTAELYRSLGIRIHSAQPRNAKAARRQKRGTKE